MRYSGDEDRHIAPVDTLSYDTAAGIHNHAKIAGFEDNTADVRRAPNVCKPGEPRRHSDLVPAASARRIGTVAVVGGSQRGPDWVLRAGDRPWK